MNRLESLSIPQLSRPVKALAEKERHELATADHMCTGHSTSLHLHVTFGPHLLPTALEHLGLGLSKFFHSSYYLQSHQQLLPTCPVSVRGPVLLLFRCSVVALSLRYPV